MMKLGTQTGSLVNHVLSRAVVGQPEPRVGMGATVLCWTDRHAATIVRVESVRGVLYVTVQEDRAVRTDKNGQSESQTWEYTRDPGRSLQTFRRTESGTWQAVTLNTRTGRMNKANGPGLRVGDRQEYRDPCF